MFAFFLLMSCANSVDFMMNGSVILESGLYIARIYSLLVCVVCNNVPLFGFLLSE